MFASEVRSKGNPKYFDEVEQHYLRVAGLSVGHADPQILSPIAKVPVRSSYCCRLGCAGSSIRAHRDIRDGDERWTVHAAVQYGPGRP